MRLYLYIRRSKGFKGLIALVKFDYDSYESELCVSCRFYFRLFYSRLSKTLARGYLFGFYVFVWGISTSNYLPFIRNWDYFLILFEFYVFVQGIMIDEILKSFPWHARLIRANFKKLQLIENYNSSGSQVIFLLWWVSWY